MLISRYDSQCSMNAFQRARLAELNAEHTSLTEQKAELIRKLAEVECSLKRCEIERAVWMPVNALPNEILCTILRYAFQHDRRECIKGDSMTSANPIPISHISRRFRTAMLEMPELWACIHVDFGSRRAARTMRPRLEMFLARSQPGAIAVHLRRLSFEWNYGMTTPNAPYGPVFAAKARWQHCTVTALTREAFDQVIESLPWLTALQTIQIEPVNPGTTTVSEHAKHPLASLVCLRIREVTVPMNSPLLRSLRELFLCDYEISTDYMRQIGKVAPYLDHLVLECMVFDLDGPEWTRPPPVHLPSLRSLLMIRPLSDGYERMLAWLKAPRLERLEVYNIPELLIRPVVWVAVVPMLRTMRIVSCDFCWANLDLLRTLSREVTDLDLSGSASDKVVTELMVDVDGPTPLMPYLSAVTITFMKPRLANSILPDLFRIRRELGHPITQVRLGKVLHGAMGAEPLRAIAEFTDITVVEPTVTPQYWAAAVLPDYMIKNYAASLETP